MKSMPKLSLFIQYPDPRLKEVASRDQIRRWVRSALQQSITITLRFVDSEEGQTLNRDFRHKDYATNVLTFTYSTPSPDNKDFDYLEADIILCTDVIIDEAQKQNKPLKDHLAHLIIHGVLHAQGYDHETESDANEMETLETKILARFGIADPYI